MGAMIYSVAIGRTASGNHASDPATKTVVAVSLAATAKVASQLVEYMAPVLLAKKYMPRSLADNVRPTDTNRPLP